VELEFADGQLVNVEHFWAQEDDLRDDLNAWAAWLETVENNPHGAALMAHVIQTTQLFMIESSDHNEKQLDLCCFLAGTTEGVFQIDGKGFFSKDGCLLVPEEEAGC